MNSKIINEFIFKNKICPDVIKIKINTTGDVNIAKKILTNYVININDWVEY